MDKLGSSRPLLILTKLLDKVIDILGFSRMLLAKCVASLAALCLHSECYLLNLYTPSASRFLFYFTLKCMSQEGSPQGQSDVSGLMWLSLARTKNITTSPWLFRWLVAEKLGLLQLGFSPETAAVGAEGHAGSACNSGCHLAWWPEFGLWDIHGGRRKANQDSVLWPSHAYHKHIYTLHTHTHIYVYTYTHVYTHICIHRHKYIYIYTCTHIHA